MSKQLSNQANKLWTLITEPSTAQTYREALELSWKILRETGNFLWLVLCLAVVGIDWFWENSIAAGRKTRAWVNDLSTAEKPSPEQLLTPETGKKLLDSGKSMFDSAIAAARKQLGLAEKSPAPAAPSSPTPMPSSTPPIVVASSPVVAPAEPVEPVIEPADNPEAGRSPAAIAPTEEQSSEFISASNFSDSTGA
ncbi:MAG: hypothetical protein SNJ57_05345 [Cyanobacteriota bacterium]